jgi:hypothetical protein
VREPVTEKLFDRVGGRADFGGGLPTRFASLGENLPHGSYAARPHSRRNRGDLTLETRAILEKKLDLSALAINGL